MPKPTTGRVTPRHERGPTAPHVPARAARPSPASASHDQAPLEPGERTRPTQEETVQMAGDALVTSMYTGISLVISTMVFGLFGGTLLKIGGSMGEEIGAKIGLAVGLGLALLVSSVLLRRHAVQIKMRSINLYRGIWLGMWISLGLIVVMAYVPQLVFPQYCPPGALC